MSTEAVLAVMGGVGALVTAVVSSVILYQNSRHERKQKSDAAALVHIRAAADLQQRQIERLDAHVLELQSALDQLAEEHTDCRVDVETLYGEYVRLHDYARRVAETLRKLGGDPGAVPPLAERPERPEREALAEARRRMLSQTTSHLNRGSLAVPPPPPLTPPPPERMT